MQREDGHKEGNELQNNQSQIRVDIHGVPGDIFSCEKVDVLSTYNHLVK